MKEKLVVIGNGISGLRTIEDLLEINKDNIEITIYGEEPHVNYNRIMFILHSLEKLLKKQLSITNLGMKKIASL